MLKKFLMFIVLIFLIGCTQEEEPSLSINVDGKSETLNTDVIYSHEEAVTFPAVVRSSGSKPVETEYKGIEVKKLFETLNIDIKNYSKVTLNASDGYRIIISIEEINDPSNIYLTFERDEERLKPKKEGGNGFFQLIIRRDPFSQRWIKHVDEIILQ